MTLNKIINILFKRLRFYEFMIHHFYSFIYLSFQRTSLHRILLVAVTELKLAFTEGILIR